MRTVHISNDTISFLEDGNLVTTLPTKVMFGQHPRVLHIIKVWNARECRVEWLRDMIIMCKRIYNMNFGGVHSSIRPVEV